MELKTSPNYRMSIRVTNIKRGDMKGNIWKTLAMQTVRTGRLQWVN